MGVVYGFKGSRFRMCFRHSGSRAAAWVARLGVMYISILLFIES